MALNPQGGPQTVRIAFRPIVGIGEGTIVLMDGPDGVDVYARVLGARLERRHGAWGLHLMVDPIPTAFVLNGLGEYAVDVRPVEVVE